MNEWFRQDGDGVVLLYTLKQNGWHRGEPVMVNDVMIRIENAPGSSNDLGALADGILKTLRANGVE